MAKVTKKIASKTKPAASGAKKKTAAGKANTERDNLSQRHSGTKNTKGRA
jgi:hypothetical protein